MRSVSGSFAHLSHFCPTKKTTRAVEFPERESTIAAKEYFQLDSVHIFEAVVNRLTASDCMQCFGDLADPT